MAVIPISQLFWGGGGGGGGGVMALRTNTLPVDTRPFFPHLWWDEANMAGLNPQTKQHSLTYAGSAHQL